MSRYRKTNMEAMLDTIYWIVEKLPWWASLTIAAVIYIVGYRIMPERMSVHNPNSIIPVGAVFAPLVKYASVFFAVLFAGLTIIVGVMRRLKLGFFKSHASLDSIKGITWLGFETLIGEFYRQQGYSVDEKGGDQPDGGIDLIIRKNGEKILVQCKHWKAYRVSVKIIREMYGVMVDNSASGAVVITSGKFTQDALDFAKDKPITLIDGHKLAEMIADIQKKQTSQTASTTQEQKPDDKTPICPICKAPMILRTAKHGSHIGSQFWGCKNYPKCKYTEKFVLN